MFASRSGKYTSRMQAHAYTLSPLPVALPHQPPPLPLQRDSSGHASVRPLAPRPQALQPGPSAVSVPSRSALVQPIPGSWSERAVDWAGVMVKIQARGLQDCPICLGLLGRKKKNQGGSCLQARFGVGDALWLRCQYAGEQPYCLWYLQTHPLVIQSFCRRHCLPQLHALL